VALGHDDLKQMGISSVGHRLTILKSIYDVKKAQDVPIESDHYIPLCKCHYRATWTEAVVVSHVLIVCLYQPPMPRHSTPTQH
jgi:hypothetical protein